jgi:hypothetical protein
MDFISLKWNPFAFPQIFHFYADKHIFITSYLF